MPSKNEKSIHVVATYLYHAFKFRRELIIVIHMHHTYAHGMVFNCIVFILCYGLEALNHNKSLVAWVSKHSVTIVGLHVVTPAGLEPG